MTVLRVAPRPARKLGGAASPSSGGCGLTLNCVLAVALALAASVSTIMTVTEFVSVNQKMNRRFSDEDLPSVGDEHREGSSLRHLHVEPSAVTEYHNRVKEQYLIPGIRVFSRGRGTHTGASEYGIVGPAGAAGGAFQETTHFAPSEIPAAAELFGGDVQERHGAAKPGHSPTVEPQASSLNRDGGDKPPPPSVREAKNEGADKATALPGNAIPSPVAAPNSNKGEEKLLPSHKNGGNAIAVGRSSGSSSQSPRRHPPPLFVIGIPTVKRPGEMPYLSRTLDYLKGEMSPIGGQGIAATEANAGGAYPIRVRVISLNNNRRRRPIDADQPEGGVQHRVWEKERDIACSYISHSSSHSLPSSPLVEEIVSVDLTRPPPVDCDTGAVLAHIHAAPYKFIGHGSQCVATALPGGHVVYIPTSNVSLLDSIERLQKMGGGGEGGRQEDESDELLLARTLGRSGELTDDMQIALAKLASSLSHSPLFFVCNGRKQPELGLPYDPGSDNVPGTRVRGQTHDVADMLGIADALFGLHAAGGAQQQSEKQPDQQQLRSVSANAVADSTVNIVTETLANSLSSNGGGVYMFMEDDFRLCRQGFQSLAYSIYKASYVHPDWNAIRVSYGLNGALIRMTDVPVLRASYEEHFARRPPDHMMVEWFAGEKPQSEAQKRGRPHLAFRYNLLEHFGRASSLRAKEPPHYALCYADIDTRVVFEVEAFQMIACAAEDISPCPPPPDTSKTLGPAPAVDVPFKQLQDGGQADSVQDW